MSNNFLQNKSLPDNPLKFVLCIFLALAIVQGVSAEEITADFSPDMTSGAAPDTIAPADTSSGTPAAWDWLLAYFTATPPPLITKISPDTMYRNTTMTFTITGKNFQTGQTIVEFRNESMDMIPTTLKYVSTTSITGTVTIPKNAPRGLRNIRIVTTSGGENISVNAVTVAKIPKPVMTRISPNTGYTNTTISYTITGTYFLPNQTTVIFRNASGKVLNKTILKSVTLTPAMTGTITGTIVIPRKAWVGPYNVSIITKDGGTTPGSTGDFTVLKRPPPTITSISPASSYQNTTVGYSIIGTNFLPGQTTVKFQNASGSLLAPTTVTSVTATQIRGTIVIPRKVRFGLYNVNISTIDGGSTPGTGKFTVEKRPVPTISSIKPNSTNPNTTIIYTIAGTNFIPGQTTVRFRNASGKVLGTTALKAVSPTSITGTLSVPSNAWIGPYNVNVRTIDGGLNPGKGMFTVVPAPNCQNCTTPCPPNWNCTCWNMTCPMTSITSFSPVTGMRNTTVSFTITGTNFRPGQMDVTFRNASGYSLPPAALSSVTTTRITGTIAIPWNAWAGPYNLTFSTPECGYATSTVFFTVVPRPPPVITSITPANGLRNTTVSYTIYGTNFIPGQTTLVFRNSSRSVLAPTTITIMTATMIKGTIAIPRTAWVGPYNINISTIDGGSTPGTVKFTVLPGPTVTSVTPSTGYRNTTISYTIYGTNFLPGQTTVVFRNVSGNVLNMTTVKGVSATVITGTIVIPETAWIGVYNVSVETPDSGSGTGTFTVIPRPAPVFTTIAPSSAFRNTTVSYIITGANFIPGQTSVTFKNDIGTVLAPTKLTYLSTTQIKGLITIPRKATTGLWNVNISTIDGGSTPGTGKFTVLLRPAPTISSISPTIGYQNATVNYSIVGTNFLPNQTYVTFKNTSGKFLTPNTVTKVTETRINGTIILPSRPWLGSYQLFVRTIDGGTSVGTPVYFRVAQMPPPVITNVVPSTAYTNTDLQYTVIGNNFQPGLTNVNLTKTGTGDGDIPTTVTSVSPTTISGHVMIPSATTSTGLWSVYVETVDGGNTISWDAINVLPG